jgi:hypothetical protein
MMLALRTVKPYEGWGPTLMKLGPNAA